MVVGIREEDYGDGMSGFIERIHRWWQMLVAVKDAIKSIIEAYERQP